MMAVRNTALRCCVPKCALRICSVVFCLLGAERHKVRYTAERYNEKRKRNIYKSSITSSTMSTDTLKLLSHKYKE